MASRSPRTRKSDGQGGRRRLLTKKLPGEPIANTGTPPQRRATCPPTNTSLTIPKNLASPQSPTSTTSESTRTGYVVHVGRHAFMDSRNIREWFDEDCHALLVAAGKARGHRNGLNSKTGLLNSESIRKWAGGVKICSGQAEWTMVTKMQTTTGSALKIASLLNEPQGKSAMVEEILQQGTIDLLIANVSIDVLAGLVSNDCARLQSLAADGLRRMEIIGQPFTVYLTSGMTPVTNESFDLGSMRRRSTQILDRSPWSPRHNRLMSQTCVTIAEKPSSEDIDEKAEKSPVAKAEDNIATESTAITSENVPVANPGSESAEDSLPVLSPTQISILHKSMRVKTSIKRVPMVPHWNEKLLQRVARLVAKELSPSEVEKGLSLSDFDVHHIMADNNVDQIFQMLQIWQRTENPADTCSVLQELVENHRDIGSKLDDMFADWRKDGEFLPGFITDDLVDEVACRVGSNWRNLAFELHMTSADLDHLSIAVGEESDEDDTTDSETTPLARRMLLHWRRTSGRYATRHILADALRKADLDHLVDCLRIEQRSGQAFDSEPRLAEFVRTLIRGSTKRVGVLGKQSSVDSSQHRRRLAKKRITATNLKDIPAIDETQAEFEKSQAKEDVTPPDSSHSIAVTAPVVIPMAPWEAVSNVESGPYFGVDLDNLPGRSDGSLVPLFIDKCIAFVEERGMASRGIYRVSGAGSAVNELLDLYTKDHNLDFFSLERGRFDEHTVASGLKSFLRKLPEPIIPKAVTDKLAEVPSLANDKQLLVDRLKLIVYFGMPEVNRSLLAELCKHFHRVTQHCEDNFMKASNLGIVFWPTLTRPELNANDLVLMRDLPVLLQHAVTILIESCEEIFCDVPLQLS